MKNQIDHHFGVAVAATQRMLAVVTDHGVDAELSNRELRAVRDALHASVERRRGTT